MRAFPHIFKKKNCGFFSTATIFVKTIIGNVPLKIKISLFFKNFCEKKLHIFLSLVISLSVSWKTFRTSVRLEFSVIYLTKQGKGFGSLYLFSSKLLFQPHTFFYFRSLFQFKVVWFLYKVLHTLKPNLHTKVWTILLIFLNTALNAVTEAKALVGLKN
jgi:hypothetical protein